MPTLATPTSTNLATVALVGRVNVGKSTIFNKLTEDRKAIISKIPGTTRTNNEGLILWRGKYVRLIDTGGLTFTDDVPFEEDILAQSEKAMKEADIIIFVVDAQTGILPQEKELAKRLRQVKDTPVLLVANKVDSKRFLISSRDHEWLQLGLGAPISISAASGRNIGDFLDTLYTKLGSQKRRPKNHEIPTDTIRISLVGKPNVGKSSLFNKLIGEEKVIVSPIAHTTREPHDTEVIYPHKVGKKMLKQHITFVDTAGIRRKAKVQGLLERAGIHKSIESIEDSNMVLFVLDGSETISSQDKQLGGLVEKRAKSVIILVNKWDLTDYYSEQKQKKVREMVYAHFPHIDFAPILFVSGKTGLHIHKIFPMIMAAWQARHTEIPEEALEAFLKGALKKHLPSRGKGTRHPKVLGLRQIATGPPVFEMYIKYRTSLHRSYVHFIEHRLREQFDFQGNPILIKLRKTKR